MSLHEPCLEITFADASLKFPEPFSSHGIAKYGKILHLKF